MIGQSASPEHELEHALERAIEALDFERAHQEYWKQNECFFLPPEIVERHLAPEVDKLRPNVYRNYIPGHKKEGKATRG